MIELLNEDCMAVMARYPDKYFDLAIIDPPYGLGKTLQHTFGKENKMNKHKLKDWDNCKPPYEYFVELFRVSKNQIIWGGNYFLDHLPSTRGFITWDKMVFIPTMSRIEMAWTSFDKLPLLVQINNNDANRIHLTQKPVKLYEWLLTNYAKPGQKILDTHGGSMSIAIACHNLGFDLVCTELDTDYYQAAVKRYNAHILQQRLFV